MAETPNNTEKTYDVGENVKELGFLYIGFQILKWAFPIFIILFILFLVWPFLSTFITLIAQALANISLPQAPQLPQV